MTEGNDTNCEGMSKERIALTPDNMAAAPEILTI